MKTKTIKITDHRYGGVLSTGINGRLMQLPVGQPFDADKETVDHLTELGVAFEPASGAGPKMEGSEEGPAPSFDQPTPSDAYASPASSPPTVTKEDATGPALAAPAKPTKATKSKAKRTPKKK